MRSEELDERIDVVVVGRVPHPKTCGACNGAGCPIVAPAKPLVSYLETPAP